MVCDDVMMVVLWLEEAAGLDRGGGCDAINQRPLATHWHGTALSAPLDTHSMLCVIMLWYC